jgi:predicted small secreted protein
MRRRVGQVLLVAVTATAVAACSQTVGGVAQRADSGVPDPDRSYGYVDNRCGLLDDTSVQATLGAAEVTRPYSGAVCQYILSLRPPNTAATTVDVTFSWFEAGSLERERGLAAARGAVVKDIIVERHKAFSARRDKTGVACSATAAAGTGVLSWWVQLRGQKTGDPCADAEKLLSATLRSDM